MPEKPKLPSLFVASSKEGLDAANAVHQNLDEDADVVVWPQGVFWPSERNLDSLVRILGTTDFAVFMFTPDDLATIRNTTSAVVRDNVVFELGLFIGRLGSDRCFILRPRTGELHLPSDLIGVNGLPYNDARSDENIRAALGPACNDIRMAIRRFGDRAVRTATGGILSPAGYDDADIRGILRSWFGNCGSVRDRVLHFDQIDTDLRLPKGSAAKFLEPIAAEVLYATVERGGRTILFKYQPEPPRRGRVLGDY